MALIFRFFTAFRMTLFFVILSEACSAQSKNLFHKVEILHCVQNDIIPKFPRLRLERHSKLCIKRLETRFQVVLMFRLKNLFISN